MRVERDAWAISGSLLRMSLSNDLTTVAGSEGDNFSIGIVVTNVSMHYKNLNPIWEKELTYLYWT